MHAAHHGHAHAAPGQADKGRLRLALALIAGFIAVEVATGVIAHSLALLSDAAHMVTDAGALALSLLALRLAARPAAGAMTFGFRRAEILSAQANGISLVIFAGFIAYEAIRRLLDPQAIGRALAARAGVVEVHDLHVWEVSSGFPALSAHVLVSADTDCHAARRELETLLQERFGIDHTTLQVDHDRERLIGIEPIERLELGTPPNVPR